MSAVIHDKPIPNSFGLFLGLGLFSVTLLEMTTDIHGLSLSKPVPVADPGEVRGVQSNPPLAHSLV